MLETERLDLHTCMPGTVRSYDQENQTAEVILGVRRVVPSGDDDEADTVTDYPILPAVPVGCLRGSGYFVHVPLREGDHVLVLFSESDINEWRRTGTTSDPGVATRHALSGAVCIPALHSQRNPLSAGNTSASEPCLTIGYEGGPYLRVREGQVEAGGTQTLALSGAIEAHLAKISEDLTTVFTAATAGTPTYIYGTEIVANPIATTTTRGA